MSDETRKPDHESDPAHNDEVGHDWADEGGATRLGPATHSIAGPSEAERVSSERIVVERTIVERTVVEGGDAERDGSEPA